MSTGERSWFRVLERRARGTRFRGGHFQRTTLGEKARKSHKHFLRLLSASDKNAAAKVHRASAPDGSGVGRLLVVTTCTTRCFVAPIQRAHSSELGTVAERHTTRQVGLPE